MLVKDLIAQLSKLDPKLPVYTHRDEETCECCGTQRVFEDPRNVHTISVYWDERGDLRQLYQGLPIPKLPNGKKQRKPHSAVVLKTD